MPNVAIINGNKQYMQMFTDKGWDLSTIEEADLLQFCGGHDVNPQLYGEAIHPRSCINTERDDVEKSIFDKYWGKKHMAGICRGGQFLNVMCGGKMYQHHTGHPSLHRAWVYNKMLSLTVSSTHHQVMRPNWDKAILLMGANEGSIGERMEGEDIVKEAIDTETEALLYPDDMVLCFQPHPEFYLTNPEVEDCKDLYFSFLEELMDV